MDVTPVISYLAKIKEYIHIYIYVIKYIINI